MFVTIVVSIADKQKLLRGQQAAVQRNHNSKQNLYLYMLNNLKDLLRSD